ncbi:MAG: hypothetical protein ACJAYX_004901, partial [Planctomycetota bacterium]
MAETGLSETNVTENQGHKPRRPMMIRRTLASAFVVPLALLSFAGCSGSGGGGGTANSTPGGTVQPELSLVEYGRLVDVYGLQVTPGGTAIPVLFKADVVIGGNIQDQRPTESNLSDAEIL